MNMYECPMDMDNRVEIDCGSGEGGWEGTAGKIGTTIIE